MSQGTSSKTVLTIAKALARARELKAPMILASTTGKTAEILLNSSDVRDIELTVVTYPEWCLPVSGRFDEKIRQRLEERGGWLLIHNPVVKFPLNWIRWVAKTFKLSSVIARDKILDEMLGTGGKVCFKIAELALKLKRLKPFEKVVTVAGTESGGNTALLLQADGRGKRLEILEIIARESSS